MMTERQIFVAALELKDRAARQAYVLQACGPDDALRQRVEALLENHDRAGSFLEFPPPDVAQTADRQTQERPGGRIGPYKLLQELGEGGMGTVFMAEQTEPVQRKVALKIIKAGMDSRQVIARFEAERQALALMDHPNIAKVLDAGATSTGRPYFVMELFKGISITKYCDQEHLTLQERLELFIPVCQAVQHAHQKGLIHRDLKPSNVLIALYDGKPIPKIIDFGVAKATAQKLTERTMFTEVGSIVGTLEYMAPEQAELNNLDIDTRADIYSLGVILYELLTGGPPFTSMQLRSAAFHEMLRMIREVEPPKPSTKLSSSDELPSIAAHRKLEPKKLTKLVHGDLDCIAMKCLEKDRGRRYETANGLAFDLQRYLHEEPVLAGPPSATYRLRKFVRRNKRPVLAMTALALAIVLGLVGVTWQWWEANLQRNVADRQRLRAQRHYEKALAVIDRLLTRVGEKRLLNVPYMDDERRKLLEDALEFYRGLLLEESSDPAVRREVGQAYGRTAAIYRLLGRMDETERDWQHALETQESLAAQFLDAPQYRQDLAASHRGLGTLYRDTVRYDLADASYQKALDIEEQLVRDDPQETAHQSAVVETYNLLGTLYHLMSRPKDAQTIWDKARPVAEKLVRDHVGKVEYQVAFAHNQHQLGLLYRELGRHRDSEAAYGRALTQWRHTIADHPDNPEYRLSLATSQNGLALLLASVERPTEADEAFQECLGVIKALAEDHPDVPDYRARHAMTLNNMGLFYSGIRKTEQAEEAYRQALSLYEELTRRYPKIPLFAVFLGSTCGNMGKHLTDHGQPKAALEWYARAIGTQQKIIETEPRHKEARAGVHSAHYSRGSALVALGRHSEAKEDWKRVIDLSEGESHENYRIYRPRALAYFGEHARAIAEAETLFAQGQKRGWVLDELAGACALASAAVLEDSQLPREQQTKLNEHYAARAVELLRQASAAGFYQSPSRVAGLQKKNRRLEALRSRADFQQLVSELEAKATP